MNALRDLLNQAIRDQYPDTSNRELAKLAGVSRGTVDNYLKGVVVRPTEEILQAFHKLLSIPIQDLRKAAGLPRGEAAPYSPPLEANLLSRRQRETLDAFIRAVVEERGVSDAVPSDSSAPAGAQGEADKDENSRAANGRRLRKVPDLNTADQGGDADDTPPNDLADAARTEPGYTSSGKREDIEAAVREMTDDQLRDAAAKDPLWAEYIRTRHPERADDWDF